MRNTKTAYGAPAKILHWLLAALLLGQSVLGLVFSDMPRGDDKSELLRLHASFGLLILAFMLLRLGVRAAGARVEPVEGTTAMLRKVAHCAHLALYLLIFLLIGAGIFTLLTVGWNVDFFGVTIIPTWFERDMDLHHLFEEIHVYSWYVLAGFVGLHIIGVIYHTFVLKDGTLARMGPSVDG
ncbi:cytochrome b [Kordiimonas aestuarii]|uniref:cytochrome b n=1 Tax=Kordiimonas aestuarii TaxID=1005925 RepID=UPI0021CE33E2|nr:cytochrome b/b6 domain-containing protein [Kordiimonas aestuarii]